MTVLVCTPTGNIGRYVVRELLNRGESIRVIVRNPDKLNADIRDHLEVFQGSIDDIALLTRALNDVEVMFWSVPHTNTQENVLDYYLHFANAAAKAIQQTRTPRIVAVSSGGKGLAKNAGPISALHAMEDVLNSTRSATKYLRCGSFMENFLWNLTAIAQQGMFFYPLPGDFAMPMVAACDIGIMAAQWLQYQDWSGHSGVAVHGPEDLSYQRASEIFSEVLGKPVRFQQISPEACRESLLQHGSSPAFAQAYQDMCAEVASGIYRAEPRTSETTTSTTLRQWAEKIMLPALNQVAATVA